MFIVDSNGNVDKLKKNYNSMITQSSIFKSLLYTKSKSENSLFQLKHISGTQSPIIICINGFLTENDKTVQKNWIDSLKDIYPKCSIVHLVWESKNLRVLGKALLKAVPYDFLTILGSLSKPWNEASNNAYKVGEELSVFLSQGNGEYILVGHSLGARVIYACLSDLKEKGKECTIRDVHLLGGAVSNSSDNEDISWQGLSRVVDGKIRNYYSKKDAVLKYLYLLGEVSQFKYNKPIGRNEIDYPFIKNIDLSLKIGGHSEYHDKLSDILKTELNK